MRQRRVGNRIFFDDFQSSNKRKGKFLFVLSRVVSIEISPSKLNARAFCNESKSTRRGKKKKMSVEEKIRSVSFMFHWFSLFGSRAKKGLSRLFFFFSTLTIYTLNVSLLSFFLFYHGSTPLQTNTWRGFCILGSLNQINNDVLVYR